MFSQHPEIAKKWAGLTPDMSALPEKVKAPEKPKALESPWMRMGKKKGGY